MKFDIDIVSPTQRKIRVELPGDAVNREFVRAYDNLGRRARIKGFRPGKAPRSVLEKLYSDEVKGQVLSHLVEHSLGECFKERGLKIIADPKVEADGLEEGKAFAFSAVVEVKPEFEVENYRGLELEKIKLAVSDEQVESALGRLQDGHAQLVPVEDRDQVEQGDFVTLDFVGAVDGKPFEGGKAEHYVMEVGGGHTLMEFEAALVGLKKDVGATIRVPYPQDHFNRELAGRTVEFSVSVREIKKKVLPSLDDEFAKDHGACATLAELRDKLRARLESELRDIQTRELKEQLVTRLVEAHGFEVPQTLVERQLRYLVERRQGRQPDSGRGAAGDKSSIEQLRKDLEPHARRQVKAMLLLEKIAERENVRVSDGEMQQRVEGLTRSAGEQAASLRQFYARADAQTQLRDQMATDRTLGLLLEWAKVKEIDPPIDAPEKNS